MLACSLVIDKVLRKCNLTKAFVLILGLSFYFEYIFCDFFSPFFFRISFYFICLKPSGSKTTTTRLRGCDFSCWLYILRRCVQWRHVNYTQKLVLKVRKRRLLRRKPRNIAMETSLCTLCMAVVLASITQCSGAIGPVIKCEPCDAGVRLLCKPLPKDCAETVREPGCGCCMTCALVLGQPCGVYTGRCGSGMTCLHQPGETKPLQALLEGRGICANSNNKRPVSTIPQINEIPGRLFIPDSSFLLVYLGFQV